MFIRANLAEILASPLWGDKSQPIKHNLSSAGATEKMLVMASGLWAC
jgi:hypothetical protein